MSILDNLKRTEVAVYVSNFKKGDLGRKIGDAAVAAIMNGLKSKEWQQYMALFCDTPAELERLTVPKDGEDDYLPQMRAYIVANAVCAGETGTRTSNKVDSRIEPIPDADVTAELADLAQLKTDVGFSIPQF
jgi:hypothetical protein